MIRKRLRAVEGLVERFEYLARADPGAAVRFVDAVEAALKAVEKMPGIGRRWGARGTSLGTVRVRAVTGFESYRLYYREIPGGIEWLAIRHAAQDEPETLEDE